MLSSDAKRLGVMTFGAPATPVAVSATTVSVSISDVPRQLAPTDNARGDVAPPGVNCSEACAFFSLTLIASLSTPPSGKSPRPVKYGYPPIHRRATENPRFASYES